MRALLLGSIVEHRSATDHPDVRDAERAIARLAAGTYGSCEGCGAAIALDLLLVTPHAQHCGQCRDVSLRAEGGGAHPTSERRTTTPYKQIVIATGAGTAAVLSAVDDLIVRSAPAPEAGGWGDSDS